MADYYVTYVSGFGTPFPPTGSVWMGDGDNGFINGTWVSLFSGNSSAGTARVSFASDPSGFVAGFGAGTDGNGLNWQAGATSVTPVGGGGPVTATASVTLANATMSASGKTVVTATASVTLANATMSASGTATSITTGTIAVMLAATTITASGSPIVTGSVAVTLANASSSAIGTSTVVGSVAATLANATMSASGAPIVKGTAAVTLANATMSASGTATSTTTGTIAVTLSNAVMAAAANPVVAALLAVTLADAVMAATGIGFVVPITPQPGPLQRHIEPFAVTGREVSTVRYLDPTATATAEARPLAYAEGA